MKQFPAPFALLSSMLDSPMRYVMTTTLMAMVYTAMAKEPDLTLECQKQGDQQVFT